jgi:hypothetical protein
MSDPRQHAHQLIDRLPQSRLTALVGLLETIVDPADGALRDVPFDDEDEPVTEEDRRRFHEGQTCFAQGQGIPMEDVLTEFGLKPEDFPLSK